MKIVPAEKISTGISTPISSMRAITPAPIALNAATAQKASSHAKRAADRRDEERLAQQQTNDLPTRAANRQTHRDLALARRCASKREVRHVRARDQQNENRASRGNEQRFAVFANEIAQQRMNFDSHTCIRRRILSG